MNVKRVFIFLSLFFLTGCGSWHKTHLVKVSQQKTLMGTYVELDVCTSPKARNTADAALEDAWKRLERISWQMNVYDPKSDLTKINTANGKPVVIHPDTYFVLKSAEFFWKKTGGTFDPTIWPLLKFWREAAKENKMPTPAEVDAVKTHVGFKHVRFLGNNMVATDAPGIQVDLGGIAKGYAIDEAARIFREHGLHNFFVDAGGDVYAGGYNCEGKPWRVGISDPKDTAKLITIVAASDKAVATSGNYAQYVEIEGEHFSHIINPITGYPQRTVTSATVIADSAQSADALATSLTILGDPKGTQIINGMGEEYASFILMEQEDGRYARRRSKNFHKFEIKE